MLHIKKHSPSAGSITMPVTHWAPRNCRYWCSIKLWQEICSN